MVWGEGGGVGRVEGSEGGRRVVCGGQGVVCVGVG